ncbi:TPA: hypothetical protein ORP82_003740 [Escherichia coli]|nr:hypothetical protein [Escherichia coli]
MINLKAVIPVAGLGMHMLPATKAIPKEMLPIVDKPMIQYNSGSRPGHAYAARHKSHS